MNITKHYEIWEIDGPNEKKLATFYSVGGFKAKEACVRFADQLKSPFYDIVVRESK